MLVSLVITKSIEYIYRAYFGVPCPVGYFFVIEISFFLCFQDLDLHDILIETEKRGIAFDQLLTIPEQDEWVYSDGKSTTCVAFILSMYKAAGIFGPISSSIQVTEFTVSQASLVLITNL